MTVQFMSNGQAPSRRVAQEPVVHIVDDDESICRSLAFLLQSVGLVALTYPDARTFLDELDVEEPAVVIVEARMPVMGGIQLQEHLAGRDYPAPVIFCSAFGDIATAVRAVRAGAVEFFEKPYDPQRMLEVVQAEIVRAEKIFVERDGRRILAACVAQLTAREREVLRLVIEGLPSQQIANRLGTSVKTIDVHRARIRAKTNATSLGALVRDILHHRLAL